jgi:hypothetical protein
MTSIKLHNFNQIRICSNLSKTLSCTQAHLVDPDASKSALKADTTLYLVPVFHEKLRKAFKLVMPQSMDLQKMSFWQT